MGNGKGRDRLKGIPVGRGVSGGKDFLAKKKYSFMGECEI